MPYLDDCTFIDLFNIDSRYSDNPQSSPDAKFPMRISLNEMQPDSYTGMREICLSHFSNKFPWAYGYRVKDNLIAGVVLLEVDSLEIADKVLSDVYTKLFNQAPMSGPELDKWRVNMRQNIVDILEGKYEQIEVKDQDDGDGQGKAGAIEPSSGN